MAHSFASCHLPKTMQKHTLKEDAQSLAAAHCKADPSTIKVYLCSSEGDDEVKLLEVSCQEPTYGDAWQVKFDAAPEHGIDHKSSVILVGEEDFCGIASGAIKLPFGWSLEPNQALIDKTSTNAEGGHEQLC